MGVRTDTLASLDRLYLPSVRGDQGVFFQRRRPSGGDSRWVGKPLSVGSVDGLLFVTWSIYRLRLWIRAYGSKELIDLAGAAVVAGNTTQIQSAEDQW